MLETQLAGLDRLDDHAEVEKRVSGQIRTLLSRYEDEICVPDLRLAVYMLLHSLHALVHAVVYERPSGVSLKLATREMVRMASCYLRGSRATASSALNAGLG